MFPFLLVAAIAAAFAYWVLGLYVDGRELRYLKASRGNVPRGFEGRISGPEQQKAVRYELARLRMNGVMSAADLVFSAVSLVWLYDWIAGAVASWLSPSALQDLAVIACVSAVGLAVSVPEQLYRTFVIEARFGFNRTTWATFLADKAKAAVLTALIGGPLCYGLFLAMRSGIASWWLLAWLALLAVMLCAPAVYIRLIAPLFNRFEPIADSALRARVEGLLQRSGFRSSGVFVVDSSRRSSHGNAYFIGFGPAKRIVLFDTLITQHSGEEIEAVLAHELGHLKKRHNLFRTGLGAAQAFLYFAAFGWLARQPWLIPGFGWHHGQSCALAFLGAGALAAIVMKPLGALSNLISWRHEYEADDFARRMIGSAAPLASALLKLSRSSARSVTNDPVFARVNFDHPPVAERIARLEAGA